MRLGKCQWRNQQAGERDNYFFHDASFLMNKSRERVWIEQEPVGVFATVQFHLAGNTADGKVISRKREQLACLMEDRASRSGAGVRS